MQRASLYMLLLLIIISACTQRKWDEDKISDKLKTVFPSATIHVMDSFAIKKDRPDIFDMPLPVYKASIKEEKDTADRFLFYFYDIPELDTIYKTIFSRVMLNHLRTGFGTAKANYVFGTPQFDRTGHKLIVYAVSLSIADEKYVGDKEKKIRGIFELQKTTIRDLKLEDLEDEKK